MFHVDGMEMHIYYKEERERWIESLKEIKKKKEEEKLKK